MPWQDGLVERGLVPDPLLRLGIRLTCRARLRSLRRRTVEQEHEELRALQAAWRAGPVAIETRAANEQHYEVAPAFFRLVLGPRRKYSACYWPPGVETLAEAEEASLAQVCERARIEDGQHVLDLGCGWGSFTLWVLERYPRCRVVAVSNSAPQRELILEEAARLGAADRLEVITADVNDLALDGGRFDRVVSIEMLEHLRNHREALRRVSTWLRPDGLAFVHVFTHRWHAYPYDDDAWMARRFFTGGMMPSDALLLHEQRDLELVDHWVLDGTHYQRTAEAWVDNIDARRAEVLPVLAAAYGADRAQAWRRNWRVFFLALAELWGYRGGREWLVSHYLFRPRP